MNVAALCCRLSQSRLTAAERLHFTGTADARVALPVGDRGIPTIRWMVYAFRARIIIFNLI